MEFIMLNFHIISEFSHLLWTGIQLTLAIALMSCIMGITIGIITGIILSQKKGLWYYLTMLYVTIIRGTPMLIQVTTLFYLLRFAGYPISAFWSAIISIGLNSGAYMSQIVAAGIKSVPQGQREAAQVLGFTNAQTMRYIILPQAIRTMIPAFGNELITLVKDSSLASIIGVYELTKQAEVIISQTFDAPTIFCTVALIYLTITTLLSCLISYIDKRLHHHA